MLVLYHALAHFISILSSQNYFFRIEQCFYLQPSALVGAYLQVDFVFLIRVDREWLAERTIVPRLF